MSVSKKIIEKVAVVALEVPKAVAKEAPMYMAAAGAAAAAGIGVHIADKAGEAKKVKKAHKDGYELGINQGNKLASKKVKNQYFARIAIAYYFAQADGRVTEKERNTLKRIVDDFLDNFKVTKKVNDEINSLTTGNVSFSTVQKYLDELEIDQIEGYRRIINDIINADNKVTYQEIIAYEEFNNYYKKRKDNERKKVEDVLEEDEFFILSKEEINKSIEDHSLKYALLESQFEKKTKLSKKEVSLTMVATGLQILRIYIVNEMAAIEKANHGKKEEVLKEAQKKILLKFDDKSQDKAKKYYAPLNMIINTRGVPYDTTTFEKGKKLDIFKGVEKGVNHRFATLGHVPLAGLLVGTVNIMTSTITSTRNKIPTTYHVSYTADGKKFKDPFIVAKPASFSIALHKSIERTKEDQKPFVAALLKQLIHIATDTYTPAGIPLPGASLIFTENQVEELTQSFNFGDVNKFAASLTFEMFVNMIIEMIHKCMIIEEGGDINNELNIVRSKKIVDYSMAIATSSNVIKTYLSGNFEKFDLAGLSYTVIKLFKDINFLYDVKYEFINNGLKEMMK